MALLPNPEEFTRVKPSASQNVSSYRPGIVASALGEQGDRLTAMADAEIKRLDELKANDAETELMRSELELSTKYREAKGGDVLKPDFNRASKDSYETRQQEIASRLSTPSQKARFQEIAKRRAVSFDAGRISYAMGEADRFETAQHEARIQVLTDGAVAQYASPDVVAANAMQLNEEVVKWGIKKGLNDPEIAAAFHKKVNGNFYSALIEQAITNNDTSTANTLYAASSRFLSEEQNRSISNQLKVGNAYDEGQKLAIKAQTMAVAGAQPAEIELMMMGATNQEAYRVAQTSFTNLQQANTKAQNEALGAMYMLYEEGGSNGIAHQKVLQSGGYKKLTDLQRSELNKYIETDLRQDKTDYRSDAAERRAVGAEGRAVRSEARSVSDFNERRSERAAAFKTQETMTGVYRVMSNPNVLKNTTVAEIMSQTAVIGPANVKSLLDAKKLIEAGTEVPKIDKALMDSAKPAPKDSDARKNDAYEALVQIGAIEFAKANPGKQMSLEQQQTILRNANSEYNIAGKWSSVKSFDLPSGAAQQVEARAKQLILMTSDRVLTKEEVDQIYEQQLTQKTSGKIKKAKSK